MEKEKFAPHDPERDAAAIEDLIRSTQSSEAVTTPERREKVLTNVLKGSARERFFELLDEAYPELGLDIDEEPVSVHGKPLEGRTEVLREPLVTDVAFIIKVENHPVIKAILNVESVPPLGEEQIKSVLNKVESMEQPGGLLLGTANALLAKYYSNCIQQLESASVAGADESEALAEFEEKLNDLRTNPLIEVERDHLMRTAIEEEVAKYRKEMEEA